MGQGIFANPPQPLLRGVEHSKVEKNAAHLTPRAERFHNDVWAWTAGGFATIPCTATGTNAYILTPINRPEIGSSGYTHLLLFVFVAPASSTGTVTITVQSTKTTLASIPAYIAGIAAGAGNVTLNVPYFAIYCDAAGALPARFVLK